MPTQCSHSVMKKVPKMVDNGNLNKIITISSHVGMHTAGCDVSAPLQSSPVNINKTRIIAVQATSIKLGL